MSFLRMKALAKYSVLTIIAGFVSTTPSYSAKQSLVGFPVKIESPEIQATEKADDKVVVYSQNLQLADEIVTRDDFNVHVESPRKELLQGPPEGPFDFTVPAGALMVKGLWEGHEIYCTSKTVKESTFFGYFDVGVCLSDGDGNGTFDALYLADEWPFRIRTAVDIQKLRADPPAVVSVHYDHVSATETPIVKLRAMPLVSKGLFGKSPILTFEICSPPSLGLSPSAIPSRCNEIDWVVNIEGAKPTMRSVAYLHRLKAGDQGSIGWGPVKFSYVVSRDETLQTKSEGSLPMGSGFLVNAGHHWFGSNQSEGVSIIHVVTTKQVTSYNEPTAEGQP